MEPIISKLQEGVKYPRFERDATTIINDLVEHITKERGVYSSSIEPNPNEHKVWFNTNNNTLNIYENGKWNTISGQGGGGGSSSGAIINSATINSPTIADAFITGSTTINGATINSGTITGSININGATISGATISGGEIYDATIRNATINEGGNLNYGNLVLLTYTGTVTNPILIPNGGNIGYPNKSIKISNVTISGSTINGATISEATISGGNIDVNKIKAKSIETPLISLTSGSINKSIQLLGDNYVFNGKLADSTFLHSIDLNHGSITGLTSIKTLSYTGLTIEPYSTTGTGTPIKIYGMEAGVHLYGVATLSWQKGTSYGNSMTFNTNNNIINSNFDSFNITNGNIALTSGMISGSANVDLTLSGTISGGTISGGSIIGATISRATIDDAFITGSTTINGATISGATMSGGNIYGARIDNATIGTGSALLYAGSKILVTYTGSVDNPILMPNGGNIGYSDASLKICGVTLTGGDFTKLKNLQ